MVLSLSCSVSDLVAKLTKIINNLFGHYLGRRFETEIIQWVFRSQISYSFSIVEFDD